MTALSRQIEREFIVLSPDKKATVETCDASLYERLNQNYHGFAEHELVSLYEFDSDWTTWEMHPHGDEVVMLMSGEMTLILQQQNGE